MNENKSDKIRGCMIGGAAGDALGYAVEFFRENQIFEKYGKSGITEYELDVKTGKALISDDTQMSLFTANGILNGQTRNRLRGKGAKARYYVRDAYLDWLLTQDSDYSSVNSHDRYTKKGGSSWLLDIPELFNHRAPGGTCLQALRREWDKGTYDDSYRDFFEEPVNDSKGCGGIMRVAPWALPYSADDKCGQTHIYDLDLEAAHIASITHGHPLGFMPAAVIVHIINRVIYSEHMSLKEIVLEAVRDGRHIFNSFSQFKEIIRIVDLAIKLSENDDTDIENIHKLGEGWVAEEAMGIAIYCALKYQDDFSNGIIAAVNHNGDSDSTGAITGNILGALIGYDAIEDKWKDNLELKDVILELSDDLSMGCQMMQENEYFDKVWACKYMDRHMYNENTVSASYRNGTEIRMIEGDITKIRDVSAIVNAANNSLLGGGGVDGAIHRAAGPLLLKECRTLKGCNTGDAKITKAYQLPCDYVIHTVGPVWNGGSNGECDLLACCYRNSLKLAVENGIRSIAFPSVSTGVYHFPLQKAAKIAVATVLEFIDTNAGMFDAIEWVLFDENTFKVYNEALKELNI